MTQAKPQSTTVRTCITPGCGNQFPINNKQRAKKLCTECAGKQKTKAAHTMGLSHLSTTKRGGGHAAVIPWVRAERTEALTAQDIMDTSGDRLAKNINRILRGELIFAHSTAHNGPTSPPNGETAPD